MIVDLTPWLDNTGATSDSTRALGDFDGWGRSFPFEEITSQVLRDPGRLPGCADNVSCTGQVIRLLEPVAVTACHVLGASEGGSFISPMGVRGPIDESTVDLVFPDWMSVGSSSPPPWFRATHAHEHELDQPAVRPALWMSSHEWPGTLLVDALVLPANPSMHVFAVSLLTLGTA